MASIPTPTSSMCSNASRNTPLPGSPSSRRVCGGYTSRKTRCAPTCTVFPANQHARQAPVTASRPSMRFVPVKTAMQQGQLAVHRLREGYKEERTACLNRIRGLLTEFGIVIAQSPEALRRALPELLEDASNELSSLARMALQRAQMQWAELDCHIAWCDECILAHVRSDDQAKAAMQ